MNVDSSKKLGWPSNKVNKVALAANAYADKEAICSHNKELDQINFFLCLCMYTVMTSVL